MARAPLQRHRLRTSFLCLVCLLASVLTLSNAKVTGFSAQRKQKTIRAAGKKENRNRVADSKADIVKVATDHRTNLQRVLSLLEAQEKRSSELVQRKKALYDLGVLARRDLDESERELASVRADMSARKLEIAQTDALIAEATAAEQIARMSPMSTGGYLATAALIRYTGTTAWFLSDISRVEQFFTQRFGGSLPISALGQSPVHSRLGFDHHNAADIAAHPDSVEGQAIMAYLRSAGISFIAFRQAVSGSSTGAHIHIGAPSRRLTR